MKVRPLPPLLIAAALLAGCGGGGRTVATSPQVPTAAAYGTITLNVARSPQRAGRAPKFISTSTTAATLYIDTAVAATSTGNNCATSCTITLSYNSTAGTPHNFAVQINDGSHVLGAGLTSNKTLVPGANNFTMTVNGVLANVAQSGETTSGATASGTLTVADFDSVVITSAPSGASTAFDNGSPTFSTNDAQSPAATVSVTGSPIAPNGTGTYAYSVSCQASETTAAPFHITVTPGGASTALAGITLSGVTYPSSVGGTVYSYTCTNGVISDASGTITLQ